MTLLTDAEVCVEIGIRVRAERRRRHMSQAELSERSGISLRTYKRFEKEGAGSIATLVAILRALDRLVGIQLLMPQPPMKERKDVLREFVDGQRLTTKR